MHILFFLLFSFFCTIFLSQGRQFSAGREAASKPRARQSWPTASKASSTTCAALEEGLRASSAQQKHCITLPFWRTERCANLNSREVFDANYLLNIYPKYAIFNDCESLFSQEWQGWFGNRQLYATQIISKDN